MDLRLRRRILLFLTLVCSAAGAFADNTYHQKETDDYVTLGDLTVEPGKDEVYKLKVNLNGTQIYTAFEMDIKLPSGLEPVMEKDSKGDMRPKVRLWKGTGTIFPFFEDEDEGIKDFSHSVIASYGAVDKNILRMACYSIYRSPERDCLSEAADFYPGIHTCAALCRERFQRYIQW